MSTVANWWFSQSGIGIVGIYTDQYGYAGGLALAGFGDTYQTFAVTNLGGGNIALSVVLQDEADGNNYTLYLNWHYQVSNDPSHNPGMLLWNGFEDPPYGSNSIGSEQTFLLVNLATGTSLSRPRGARSQVNTWAECTSVGIPSDGHGHRQFLRHEQPECVPITWGPPPNSGDHELGLSAESERAKPGPH